LRGRSAHDPFVLFELYHRAMILEDLVAARMLDQPVADLLTDHFVLIRVLAGRVGVPEQDRAHRDTRLIEELE
jgi:hypothetical protein